MNSDPTGNRLSPVIVAPFRPQMFSGSHLGPLRPIYQFTDDAQFLRTMNLRPHRSTRLHPSAGPEAGCVKQPQGDPQAELETLRSKLGPLERIMPEAGDAHLVRVTLTCRMKTGGGRVWIEGDTPPAHEPPDKVMIKGLQTAHRLAAAMGQGGVMGQPETLLPDQAPDDAFDRKRVRLAFLAPDIQRALLEGRRPPGLTLKGVLNADIPPSWEDQRQMFGFPADGD